MCRFSYEFFRYEACDLNDANPQVYIKSIYANMNI